MVTANREELWYAASYTDYCSVQAQAKSPRTRRFVQWVLKKAADAAIPEGQTFAFSAYSAA